MLSNKVKEQCKKEFDLAKKTFLGKSLDDAESIIKNHKDNVNFIRREDTGDMEYIDFNWFSMALTVISFNGKPIDRFGQNNEVYDENGQFIGFYEE